MAFSLSTVVSTVLFCKDYFGSPGVAVLSVVAVNSKNYKPISTPKLNGTTRLVQTSLFPQRRGFPRQRFAKAKRLMSKQAV